MTIFYFKLASSTLAKCDKIIITLSLEYFKKQLKTSHYLYIKAFSGKILAIYFNNFGNAFMHVRRRVQTLRR